MELKVLTARSLGGSADGNTHKRARLGQDPSRRSLGLGRSLDRQLRGETLLHFEIPIPFQPTLARQVIEAAPIAI
jgi:hypothetical protein